jgi:hypothetical protein
MTEPNWVQLIIPAVSGLLGVGVGSMFNLVGQARVDLRAGLREERARADEVVAQTRAERRTYELETFTRLPKLVQQYGRVTGQALLFDEKTLREHGRLTSSLPNDQSAFDLNVELMLVTSQVLDQRVREAVDAARAEMTMMQLPPLDGRTRSSDELIVFVNDRMVRLGDLLKETLDCVNGYRRGLYAEAVAEGGNTTAHA